jgi:hypothetical protein
MLISGLQSGACFAQWRLLRIYSKKGAGFFLAPFLLCQCLISDFIAANFGAQRGVGRRLSIPA